MLYETSVTNPKTGEEYTSAFNLDVPGVQREAMYEVARAFAAKFAPAGGWIAGDARPAEWSGAMDFEFTLINPKTSEQHVVTLNMTAAEVEGAATVPDPISYIAEAAYPILRERSLIPPGFMPIGGRVRVVRSQPSRLN